MPEKSEDGKRQHVRRRLEGKYLSRPTARRLNCHRRGTWQLLLHSESAASPRLLRA
ncbi:hypothetical protein LINPERHAP1_LOCUS18629, partial [Linum perenne]